MRKLLFFIGGFILLFMPFALQGQSKSFCLRSGYMTNNTYKENVGWTREWSELAIWSTPIQFDLGNDVIREGVTSYGTNYRIVKSQGKTYEGNNVINSFDCIEEKTSYSTNEVPCKISLIDVFSEEQEYQETRVCISCYSEFLNIWRVTIFTQCKKC